MLSTTSTTAGSNATAPAQSVPMPGVNMGSLQALKMVRPQMHAACVSLRKQDARDARKWQEEDPLCECGDVRSGVTCHVCRAQAANGDFSDEFLDEDFELGPPPPSGPVLVRQNAFNFTATKEAKGLGLTMGASKLRLAARSSNGLMTSTTRLDARRTHFMSA